PDATIRLPPHAARPLPRRAAGLFRAQAVDDPRPPPYRINFRNHPKGPRPMVRKKLGRNRKNRCRFCTKEGCPRPAFVDFKDVQGLKKMCTGQGKLFSRKRSGNCAAFQRAVSVAVKRARFMALLPYVGE